MRRVVVTVDTMASGLVLLFSWSTSLHHLASRATVGAARAAGVSSRADAGAPVPAAGTGATTTHHGAAERTRYGPVQVRITVAGGKVTAAQAIVTPSGNGRDQQINSSAIPVLNQEEATAAQSARIFTVSGATHAGGGYLQSLQSAPDKAGL